MEFASFWHPSRSILSCLQNQNCIKTCLYKQYHKWFQILSFTCLPYLPLWHSFHVCVCMCVRRIHYDDCIIHCLWGFNAYIIVDLVKRGVLTLVSEIWRYRNNRCYYYDFIFLAHGHRSGNPVATCPLSRYVIVLSVETWVTINSSTA